MSFQRICRSLETLTKYAGHPISIKDQVDLKKINFFKFWNNELRSGRIYSTSMLSDHSVEDILAFSEAYMYGMNNLKLSNTLQDLSRPHATVSSLSNLIMESILMDPKSVSTQTIINCSMVFDNLWHSVHPSTALIFHHNISEPLANIFLANPSLFLSDLELTSHILHFLVLPGIFCDSGAERYTSPVVKDCLNLTVKSISAPSTLSSLSNMANFYSRMLLFASLQLPYLSANVDVSDFPYFPNRQTDPDTFKVLDHLHSSLLQDSSISAPLLSLDETITLCIALFQPTPVAESMIEVSKKMPNLFLPLARQFALVVNRIRKQDLEESPARPGRILLAYSRLPVLKSNQKHNKDSTRVSNDEQSLMLKTYQRVLTEAIQFKYAPTLSFVAAALYRTTRELLTDFVYSKGQQYSWKSSVENQNSFDKKRSLGTLESGQDGVRDFITAANDYIAWYLKNVLATKTKQDDSANEVRRFVTAAHRFKSNSNFRSQDQEQISMRMTWNIDSILGWAQRTQQHLRLPPRQYTSTIAEGTINALGTPGLHFSVSNLMAVCGAVNNNERVHDLTFQEDLGRLVGERLKSPLPSSHPLTGDGRTLLDTATNAELHELMRSLNFMRSDDLDLITKISNLIHFDVEHTRVPTATRSIAAAGQLGWLNHRTDFTRNIVAFLENAERAGPVTGSSIVLNLCSASTMTTVQFGQDGKRWGERLKNVVLVRLKDTLISLQKDLNNGSEVQKAKRVAWSISEALTAIWLNESEWTGVKEAITQDLEMLRLIENSFQVLGKFQMDVDDNATTSGLQNEVTESLKSVISTIGNDHIKKDIQEEVQVTDMPFSLDIVIPGDSSAKIK